MASERPITSLLGEIAAYAKILADDPRSTVFVPLCEICSRLGLLEEAVQIARQGIDRRPEFAPGYAALGRLRIQCGELDEARAAFQKTLALDAESSVATEGLARVQKLQEDRSAVREILEKVSFPGPATEGEAPEEAGARSAGATEEPPSPAETTEPFATATLAEIYLKQGLVRRAMKVYRDILHADPNNEPIRRKLIELKRQQSEEGAQPAGEVEEGTKPPGTSFKSTKPAPESVAEQQIAALTQWLDTIGRRRAHVQ